MENSNLELFFNYKSMLQNAKVDKSSRNRELHIERSLYAHSLACLIRRISLWKIARICTFQKHDFTYANYLLGTFIGKVL